ncbi:MAG: hypothetical protein ACK5HP_03455 [Bacilli bacterium]
MKKINKKENIKLYLVNELGRWECKKFTNLIEALECARNYILNEEKFTKRYRIIKSTDFDDILLIGDNFSKLDEFLVQLNTNDNSSKINVKTL